MALTVFNTLGNGKETFSPITPGKVKMYVCGVTVYGLCHIGHARANVAFDIIVRYLRYRGYDVTFVRNFTDIDDKIIRRANEEGVKTEEIADRYIRAFYEDFDRMGLVRPDAEPRATEHIPEIIGLVERLVAAEKAYVAGGDVYYSVRGFGEYGKLSGKNTEELLAGARVEVDERKRDPLDFALWKASKPGEPAWDSPWGPGRPGWHIECSAMSMKYLGESFDVHLGAEDLRSTHHPNEIAQSEAATRKPFVKYWVHGAFLLVDGGRMSKSLGNNYAVTDLAEKGFSPMGLRYLYLTVHYRSQQNFTWSALAAAETAWDKLNGFVQEVKSKKQEARSQLSREKLRKLDGYRKRFEQAINDDLQFPQGLAVMWEMLKSNIPDYDKADTLLDWDQILGLKLGISDEVPVPQEVREMAAQREELRRKGKFVEADEVRVKMEKLGWKVEDTIIGAKIKKLIGRG